MSKHKHLTQDDRFVIESSLNSSMSFKAIANILGKDCTTVSKEVRNHRHIKLYGSFGRPFNSCLNRFGCKRALLCDNETCKSKYCKNCKLCNSVCSDFIEEKCTRLAKPPYVCNGCHKWNGCSLKKVLYYASKAQKGYENLRSEARTGISVHEDEIQRLDRFLTPLIRNGQSIHHICSQNKDVIMCSERTIYNYVDLSLFSARNIDLPRKVKYRPRKLKKKTFKIEKNCRNGRTYDDFKTFLEKHPGIPVVQMDSVEGTKGGKIMLTIHFTESSFMLAFIRDSNTARSVTSIFDHLYGLFGLDTFRKLFPVLLTDNGSEFSNPSAIEFDSNGTRRTYVFYCDPSSPYQKPEVENNHELIRRIIPKGKCLNGFSQRDISLMMDHINSYGRRKLNDKSPHKSFSFFYGSDTLQKLEANFVPPNDIILNPSLLK